MEMINRVGRPAYLRRVVDPEPARQRFGRRVDAVYAAFDRGDPAADAAVAAIRSAAVRQRTVNGLLAGGSPAEPVPEPLAEFVAGLQRVPSWVQWDRVDAGSRAYLGIGFIWMQLLLGPASLVNTYRPPGLAQVLASTGRLVNAAPRRIQETGAWLGAAVQPGNLRIGQPGWLATAQVRLLHARVRAGLLARGWDVEKWGVPISQADLARTLLDFTVTPMVALDRLGIGLSAAERNDVHHLFRLIAHLLGIELNLQVDIDAEARSLAAVLEAVNGSPDANSRALVRAMIEAYVELLTPAIHTTGPMTRQLVLALTEIFHERNTYTELDLPLPRHWARMAVRALGAANSAARLTHRIIPAARDRAVRRSLNSLVTASGQLVGSTAYQDPP